MLGNVKIMGDSRELITLRMMAWEKAKGELNSIMVTYWDSNNKYSQMKKAINDFVKNVEDNGLQE